MAIWTDVNGNFHDDMNGEALKLNSWPQGLTKYTGAWPPVSTAAELHMQLVESAKNALIATDMVAFRCFKAGVAFPANWLTYTKSLRDIVSGTDTTSTTLPIMPTYPAGT